MVIVFRPFKIFAGQCHRTLTPEYRITNTLLTNKRWIYLNNWANQLWKRKSKVRKYLKSTVKIHEFLAFPFLPHVHKTHLPMSSHCCHPLPRTMACIPEKQRKLNSKETFSFYKHIYFPSSTEMCIFKTKIYTRSPECFLCDLRISQRNTKIPK